MISVESCLKMKMLKQSELKLLYTGLKGAGQKYTPCQIQMVTAWFLHAFSDLFNPSLYAYFLKLLHQTLVLCIHFPLCRDYTRPDLPSGDSETSGATASGLPDITAALSGMYTKFLFSSTCASFIVKKRKEEFCFAYLTEPSATIIHTCVHTGFLGSLHVR